MHLLDVGDARRDGGASRDEYLGRTARFGVRADRKHLIVPRAEIAAIKRLG